MANPKSQTPFAVLDLVAARPMPEARLALQS